MIKINILDLLDLKHLALVTQLYHVLSKQRICNIIVG